MKYKSEIKRRAYDGKFLVWKQVPYGQLLGMSEEELAIAARMGGHNVAALQSPEWVIASVHDTRGQAYRSLNPSQDDRQRRDASVNRPATKSRGTPK